MSRVRKDLGDGGEEKVADWYRSNGYRIVARNWRCRNGEIDIVAAKENTIVFCEVKTRSSNVFGEPVEAVTPAKARRLRQLAAIYLTNEVDGFVDVRFDVGSVLAGQIDVVLEAF